MYKPTLHNARLSQQVAAEQHVVTDQLAIQLLCQLCAAEGSARFDGQLDAKPGAIAAAACSIPGEAQLLVPLLLLPRMLQIDPRDPVAES